MTNPMKHFSEADLLETYYLQPGESMPVMMHLARCTDCAAKYDRLERKLREAAACHTGDKPETFWTRQRLSILRQTEGSSRTSSRWVMRTAAAAVLTIGIGSAALWQRNTPAPVPAPAPVQVIAEEAAVPADPWQSEELRDYQSIVDWESWETAPKKNGDQS